MERGNVRATSRLPARVARRSAGTRTETKNVNTFRGIEQVVRYEIQRQAAILAAGGEVLQETRHGQADGTTRAGRVKSDADDYRYFPEPDLVPVAPSREWVEEIRAGLPEMPAAKRRRLKAEWGLSDTEMRDVVNAGALELIEATAAAGITGQAARKWWMGELSRTAKEQETALEDMAVTPKQIAELQGLVDSGRLTDKLARQVLEGVLAGEGDPEAVAAARGLEVVSDDSALLAAVDEALAAQPGRGGQDPRRQGPGRRRHRRSRHEGDPRPGRRPSACASSSWSACRAEAGLATRRPRPSFLSPPSPCREGDSERSAP